MSHFLLRQPLGCARHALPHSHGRPLERDPRAGGARREPRNLGAAGAESAAQVLLLGSSRASSEQPPRATSGASSDPRSRPGRPVGSPLRGRGCSAPGGSCRRGGWRGLGAARGHGRLRAARLIVPGGARRRGRREGPRPGAVRLGGGSCPRSGPAPRPTPELRVPPPPTPGPLLPRHCLPPPTPGLGSPSGRAPGTGKLHGPRPRPGWPARRPAQAGCTAGRSPAARRPLTQAKSDCSWAARGGAAA